MADLDTGAFVLVVWALVWLVTRGA